MGICFKANSGQKNPINTVKNPINTVKNPINTVKKTLNNGIVIRYPELREFEPAPIIDVFFGENFGCINFITNE